MKIAIIGAGFGGLGAAIQLQKSGRTDFTIFERAAEVGGTWRDNVYPGCACDIPSHLYSYSFEPNARWSRAFSPQPEILNYLKHCVNTYHLTEKIRYNTSIVQANFNETSGQWLLKDSHGVSYTFDAIISATGPLNRPSLPALKGVRTFEGTAFHSSEWNTSYDLSGKRVAVIGTGASAIQIIPNIAPEVAQLTVFQRNAAWVTPREDKAYSETSKNLFEKVPFLRKGLRGFFYWLNEFVGLSFLGNKTVRKIVRWQAMTHLKNQVSDPILREKLTPNYEIGCKRVLVSDDFYPAMSRPNVRLVTDSIAEITPTGIVTESGEKHEFDAIIYSTGFVVADIYWDFQITGLQGRNLLKEWEKTGAEGYYGVATEGFPNLLFVLGPNSGLGHNSMIHMMESQYNYILSYLAQAEKLPKGAYFNLKPTVQKAFNDQLKTEFGATVWNTGCSHWYRTADLKNTTLWTGLTVRYRKETQKADMANYEVIAN